jgi:hypothetical protein
MTDDLDPDLAFIWMRFGTAAARKETQLASPIFRMVAVTSIPWAR